MFLLQMWVDLCLRHRYSELRYHPGILFLWWVQCVHAYLSLINFGWKSRVVTPACFFGSFAWKTFSRPFLWGNVYVYCWGVFFVCSKIMDPVFAPILLVYIFLLGNWVYWCWEILMSIVISCYFEGGGVSVYVCVTPYCNKGCLNTYFTYFR